MRSTKHKLAGIVWITYKHVSFLWVLYYEVMLELADASSDISSAEKGSAVGSDSSSWPIWSSISCIINCTDWSWWLIYIIYFAILPNTNLVHKMMALTVLIDIVLGFPCCKVVSKSHLLPSPSPRLRLEKGIKRSTRQQVYKTYKLSTHCSFLRWFVCW